VQDKPVALITGLMQESIFKLRKISPGMASP
jgi:hypothetical protein